jgi:hypothetical protein
MTDEAERIPRVRFPDAAQAPPPPRPPRPTGTLQEILSSIAATPPANRLEDDLTRIERALARLEAVLRQAMRDQHR